MELTLNLRENATRAHILDSLLKEMDGAQRESFDALMARAAIPEKHHHGILEVRQSIEALQVPEGLKEHLSGVYEILANAEATVHGCAVEETHFHEVGNASGIRNALAICAAFFVLDPDAVHATPVQTGCGHIECAHGLMDIPAPATAAILEGIPCASPCIEGELCTPTSAALIRYFVTDFDA